jgi:hypothetical protein
MVIAAAHTEKDVLAIEQQVKTLPREAREYIEHVLGNGFLRIQQAATTNAGSVHAEIDRIMDELTTIGFWELRRLRGR